MLDAKKKFNDYYRTVKILKERLDLPKTLKIRRIKMDDCGECILYNKRYYIYINKELDEQAALDTLIHEISHLIDTTFWEKYRGAESEEKKIKYLEDYSHGPSFGLAYSKVYRTYEKYCL